MTTAGEALEQFAKASAKGGKVSPGMVYGVMAFLPSWWQGNSNGRLGPSVVTGKPPGQVTFDETSAPQCGEACGSATSSESFSCWLGTGTGKA
jgi:hypothetical protein